MTLTNRISAAILFLLCIAGGGCLTTVYQLGAHTNNAELLRCRQAKVSVSGIVQDENRHPLNDVRMSYCRVYEVASYENIPPGYERQSNGSKAVSREFHYECNAAKHLQLKFEKSGYESKEVEFDVKATIPEGYYAASQPAEPVIRENLIIVLKRVGN